MAQVQVGSKVEVLWGLDALRGTVVEVHGPPGRPFALVEVPVLGSAGEVLETTQVSVPVDSLRLALAVPD